MTAPTPGAIPGPNPARSFIAAFLRFGGPSTLPAALAVIGGSLLEGVGLALLVPILAALLPDATGTTGTTGAGSRAVRWFAGLRLPPERVLPVVLALFCGVVALRAAVLLARDARVDRLAFGFADAQRGRVVAALAGASWRELAALRHSEITQLLSGEVANVATAAHLLPQIAVAAVLALAQFAVLALLSPRLALVALLLIVLGLVGLARIARAAVATGSTSIRAAFRIADQVATLLGGLKFAVAHDLRDALVARTGEETAAMTEAMLRHRQRHTRGGVVTTSAAALAGAALVAVAPLLGISGIALLAALAVLLRMSGPLRLLQTSIPQFATMLPAFTAVTALCERLERSAAASPDRTAEPSPTGPIALSDAWFAHADGQPVLAGASLTVAPGEMVGLAGPSGMGKTTILDLLAGLRTPDAGIVRVGGHALDGATLAGWRRRLAYVTQDAYLFDDSLARNLAWGSDDGEAGARDAALAAVGLDALVAGLPDGLATRVGERGLRFSGGQRQRFALARAILRRPALLLLDEATGALDPAAEGAVLAGVRRALPDAAIVLVAHRAETLALCDRVVTLVAGRLEERP